MPTSEQHRQKAEHNERASVDFEAGLYVDWAVTALFYAAVHWIDAYLVQYWPSPGNHADRFELMRRERAVRPIRALYQDLYQRSLDSRYNCEAFQIRDVQRLRQARFEPIRRHLEGLLRRA